MLKIPYFKQNRDYTCGPVCLRMVLAFHRISQDEITLTRLCRTNIFGTTARDMVNAAQQFGLVARTVYFEHLTTIIENLDAKIPAIVAVDIGELYEREEFKHSRHMVVVSGIADQIVHFHDPLNGPNISVSSGIFERAWDAAKREVIFIWRET